jgi:hypothetical protein
MSFGYQNALYAQSLCEFGEPIELPFSKGWILKRPISDSSQFDGMGCYPIFTCADWSNLGRDLDWLKCQLVSLTLVTDPFGSFSHQELAEHFTDLARPYKEHFVVDLQQHPEEFVALHHRRNAFTALKKTDVEISTDPVQYLDEWERLYAHLVERHQIAGIAKFSRNSFSKQLRIPGIVAFRALVDNQTAGMTLWYVQNDVAYYHLGAYSPAGYQLKVSYALFWTTLQYFADLRLKWLSLGAGAGIHGDATDGLTRFKRGWSTGARTVFLCGRILDLSRYQEIVSARQVEGTPYFPAYRANE